MTVSGRVIFDGMGRSVLQFYPVTEVLGRAGIFNTAFDNIPPTVITYDVLDRTLKTVLPDQTFTTVAYGFGADRNGTTQFETVVTDANGMVKRSYKDVEEEITSVRETNKGGSEVIWTSYDYDPLKQIVEVKDDHNNLTTVSYDNLGRRTVIDNPDTGRTETRYDLAGNAIARITANLAKTGKQISYDYNRLKTISYPDFPYKRTVSDLHI
jgi:YD repeat-containing protein